MAKTITITDELYTRLESLATGFDTPTNVIERLLEKQEAPQAIATVEMAPTKRSFQLEVQFIPAKEDAFKKLLIQNKMAWVRLYRVDGSQETKLWKAQAFTHQSDLMTNLRSGYLRGWKEKGICKAVLAINPDDF